MCWGGYTGAYVSMGEMQTFEFMKRPEVNLGFCNLICQSKFCFLFVCFIFWWNIYYCPEICPLSWAGASQPWNTLFHDPSLLGCHTFSMGLTSLLAHSYYVCAGDTLPSQLSSQTLIFHCNLKCSPVELLSQKSFHSHNEETIWKLLPLTYFIVSW